MLDYKLPDIDIRYDELSLNYCKIPNQSLSKNCIRPISNDNLPITV